MHYAHLPEPSVVWKAAEIFLRFAYAERPIPAAVTTRLNELRSAGGMAFYQSSVFETDGNSPPRHFDIRLGNAWYPHMRLSIDIRPDGTGAIFRADTHDRHITLREGSPEAGAFAELLRRNQKLADEIEAAWVGNGVPTLSSYNHDDYARAKGAMNHFQAQHA